MEQSNHLARQKPPNEYTKASGIEHKRIAGILVKKNEAVVEGKISIAITRMTPTDSKDATIVTASMSIRP